ncbi:MAG: preprotein translocase subunit SecG [Rhodospirillaceae bacterium]|nr:preprotein translocase subunit SecG [Rhodospirillaceae bacterium]MBT4670474.1 preprotein translocase subunit SecG [Rhodospirillaceae bacterium]MBT5841212.1 preprotein translocase subunit SecG [Rhodospirillaceae bacterium]MBT6292686.1 preprotein translocase subunit SecG [Rhodospirillaceae bacterium]MBT6859070.1 preprotein translocase subunit SecG [Rhodospirillaceae bacterium]
MTAVLIVIHLILAIAMIFVVLIQQSEGGMGSMGGGGGGGGGMGGFMTGRAAANLLTRVTAVLAALFMVSSLALAILANNTGDRGSLLDRSAPAPANQQQGPSVPGMPNLIPVQPDSPAKP